METPTIEWLKLIADGLIPLTVLLVGWFINRKLKRIEHLQWSNQKLIEKRLDLYDEIAPQLNRLYCFFRWVGEWKDISPDDALKTKRELDKTIHINRYLLGERFFQHYDEFICLAFKTFTGKGENAKIRSTVSSALGDRSEHAHYEWSESWKTSFTEEDLSKEIHKSYEKLMHVFRDAIGVEFRG